MAGTGCCTVGMARYVTVEPVSSNRLLRRAWGGRRLLSQQRALTSGLTPLEWAGWLTSASRTFETNRAAGREKFVFLFRAAAFGICASSSVVTQFHNDSVSIQTATRLQYLRKKNPEPQIRLLRYLYQHKTLLKTRKQKTVQKTALLVVQLSHRSQTHVRLSGAFPLSGVSTSGVRSFKPHSQQENTTEGSNAL